MRLCAAPEHAESDDVARVCRAPGRGLPLDAEHQVATLLRAGRSFSESFATVAAGARQRARLDEAGVSSMRWPRLRTPAGSSGTCVVPAGSTTISESTSALSGAPSGSRSRCSSRQAARRPARPSPSTPRCCSPAAMPSRRFATTSTASSSRRFIARRAASGRRCTCSAATTGQLPHARSLEVSPQERAAGEGIEAERRLAYVAFTRAQREADAALDHRSGEPVPDRSRAGGARPDRTAGSSRIVNRTASTRGRERPPAPRRWRHRRCAARRSRLRAARSSEP